MNSRLSQQRQDLSSAHQTVEKLEEETRSLEKKIKEQKDKIEAQRTSINDTKRGLARQEQETEKNRQAGKYLGHNLLVMNACLESIGSMVSAENVYDLRFVLGQAQERCDDAGAVMREIRHIMDR